jgi:hypothetical protein
VIYWKATRPDGLSFMGAPPVSYVRKDGTPRTGIIRPYGTGTEICGPGMLHVSDAPAEVLTGGSWPCRLFTVEPVGEPVGQAGHKYGFVGLRIVEERPAHEALGPNGEYVVAMMERVSVLTVDEGSHLGAARVTDWDAARIAAWQPAWDAARDAAWDAARVAAWDAARVAARDAAWDAAWDAARVAALGAALALITRDLISRDVYEILTRPWRQVVGPIHPDDPPINGAIPPALIEHLRGRIIPR